MTRQTHSCTHYPLFRCMLQELCLSWSAALLAELAKYPICSPQIRLPTPIELYPFQPSKCPFPVITDQMMHLEWSWGLRCTKKNLPGL